MKPNKFSFIVVGFYTWIIAVFFGGVLLDIAYSNFLKEYLNIPDRAAIFSHISDILLLLGSVMILAALGAIIFSWSSRISRYLFIASFLVVILELFTPLIFSQFIQRSQSNNIGPWIRIILGAGASLLAFTGLFTYCWQKKNRE